MKRNIQIIALLMVAIFSWSCSHEKNSDATSNATTFQGTVHNSEGKTLFLHKLSVDTTGVGGSEYVGLSNNSVADSKFTLSCHPDNGQPEFYRIGFNDQNCITTIAQKGEKLSFSFSNKDTLSRHYTVKGGKDAELMCDLDAHLSNFIDSAEHLTLWYNSSNEDQLHVAVNQEYSLIKLHHTQYLKNFIAKNPTSLATITAFYQQYQRATFFDEIHDLALLEQIYKNLSKKYPKNDNVNWLKKRISLIKNKIQESEKLQQQINQPNNN
ncbi:MAG: hypothetical protein MJZ49_03380 [Bacteroidales bacterium]|nr:hypothetical protein [Bacteroidales bacterium]